MASPGALEMASHVRRALKKLGVVKDDILAQEGFGVIHKAIPQKGVQPAAGKLLTLWVCKISSPVRAKDAVRAPGHVASICSPDDRNCRTIRSKSSSRSAISVTS